MRSLLLAAALSAALMTPADAISSLTLPVQVPLAGLQQAANAGVPREFARVDQTQSVLGGTVQVRLRGTVTRSAQVSVRADGDALMLSVPIRAQLRAEPSGILAGLARDFGGEAVVTLRLTPYLTPDWQVGVKATAAHRWTDPLAVDLGRGLKFNVQALADAQVKAQLERLTAELEAGIREKADLRRRAAALWTGVQQPWPLPTLQPAYALVRPLGLGVTPPRVTPDALKLDIGATFDLSAALGKAAAAPTPTPLPALKVGPLGGSGVELSVPLSLPYAELSRLATDYAATQKLTLDVPTRPTLRVTAVQVAPSGSRLRVTVTSRLDGPLGLRVQAVTDVMGLPSVSADGRTLSLRDVQVQTRRDGLTGQAVAWLADARAEAFLTRAAHFDLTPLLTRAEAAAQAKLPFAPISGVKLSGQLGRLSVTSVKVEPNAVVVTARGAGKLAAAVDAGALLGR